ncbi:hypothetical protein [Streptomyces sp. NPDC004267]|uniref:hypothetical protein n=1 Tax=Streptomyces sp. NPDC004267 TaxID=3364694 RepID=UPI0036811BC2
MILLAGTEKSGKSYEAAAFSGSNLIGRTFWIELGEGEGHHYGSVPGARYELVRHDGSFRDILDAVRWAAWQPRGEDGKPNAIVLDSASILWELLGDEQAIIARRRAAKRAAQNKLPASTDPTDYTITSDQWNVAKRRWGMIIDALRHHDGPVIMCARMDEVTIFDAAGQPTKERTWKIQAEKKLPFEVTGTIQLRGYRRAFLTGMRSLRLNVAPDQTVPYPGFSLDKLMRDLGLDELTAAERTYVAPRPEAYIAEHDAELERLATQHSHTREARRQASKGQLPDEEEVAQAIRRASESNGNQRQALLQVRTRYGASILAQLAINTPWGRMNANVAIDKALEGVAPSGQSTPPGSSTPSPPSGPTPTPAVQGPPVPPTPTAAPEPEPEPGDEPEPGYEPDPEYTPDPDYDPEYEQQPNPPSPAAESMPTAPDDQSEDSAPFSNLRLARHTVKMEASERAAENMRAEVQLQALMVGVPTLDFVAPFLPSGGTSVKQIQCGSRLQDFIRENRPQVVKAFIEMGLPKAAEQYAKFGARVPSPGINKFLKELGVS